MNKKLSVKNEKEKKTVTQASEILFDRDKNLTYVPNDESIDTVIDKNGNPEFQHSNHQIQKDSKKVNKK